MATLLVTTREGEEHSIEAADGSSVMQAIRDAGIDELLALCGGCLSCATCHVYIDGEDVARIPGVTEDENDLLESSDHKTAQSRLSCQLIVSEALDGLRLSIAPEG
jgi:2Fe-2S ferredoxin